MNFRKKKREEMVRMLIIHITVMLWLTSMLLAASYEPLYALPGCQKKCGSVTMSYPFGIGKNCSFDEWFEIDCKVDNGSAELGGKESYTPYLKRISLEINYIDLYENKLEIFIPVNFSNYSGVSSYNLSGTPFSFSSDDNSFVGIGCNIIAYMVNHENDGNTWCSTVCNPHPNMIFGCEIPLCQNIRMLEPVILSTSQNERVMSNSTRDPKAATGFGSLASRRWLSNMRTNYLASTNLYFGFDGVKKFLVYLDWEFYNATSVLLVANKTTTSCETRMRWSKVNNSFYNNSLFLCFCREGYTGNAYLPNGCQATIGYPVNKYLVVAAAINYIATTSGILLLIPSVLLFLAILVWLLRKGVKKVTNRKMKKKYFILNGGLLLQQQISSGNGNIEKTKVFSSHDLNKATNNFNVHRVLGQGGQGTVYKGMLPDGMIIAVKKSKLVDKANLGQFINEVVILSQINHRNVVKLLGCCLETEVPLLVYEFISNGTLSQLINKSKEDFPLTWEMRLRIGAEIAGALSYMHSAASSPIYHRDMKSTNILLDDKYKAIVSDFGISRLGDVEKTHFTTQVQGTFGYLDPEYFLSSQFTEKSDVYSFGVVLVELLTGHKPIFSNTSQEVKGLALHFTELMEQNQILEMIDPQILEEGQTEEIIVVCQLAKMCLHMNGKQRPTMKKVAVQLEGILMSRENNTTDDNYDFLENDRIDLEESFDASSTSTETLCNGTTASSLDELPLVTYPQINNSPLSEMCCLGI